MKRANTATGTTQYLTLSSNSVDCIAVDFDVLQNQAPQSTSPSTLRQKSTVIAGTTSLPAFMSSAALRQIFSSLFGGIQFGLTQWCSCIHTSLSIQEAELSASKPNGIGRGHNAYQNGISLIKNPSANQNPEPKPYSRSGGRSRLAAMPT